MNVSDLDNSVAHHTADRPPEVDVLSEELANQIAAGEVVERPASVVKELIENSLDAGADRIEVSIDKGGRQRVRVSDNGCGMQREDAVRALKRHATSKIKSAEDLQSISTLGFRGEALPSIAAVSRFELKTKPRDAVEGTRITVEGGTIQQVESAGVSAGTKIEVTDLFFNTPARQKFMKTPRTESRYISKMLIRMSLSRPDVRFKLKRDGDVKLDYPAVDRLKDRILSVMGRDVYDALYPTFDYPPIEGVTAQGYYSEPNHSQRTSKNIYTYVNGRYVEDKTIMAAIRGAYRNLLDGGRYPSVVIFVDVPWKLLDVNVHPTKIEVRFNDTQPIYRAVYHAIYDALAEAPWVDEDRVYKLDSEDSETPDNPGGELNPGDVDVRPMADKKRRRSEQTSTNPQFGTGPESSSAANHQSGFSTRGAQPLQTPPGVSVSDNTGPAGDPPSEGEMTAEGYFSSLRFIGQFQRAYLICEDASGLVVIDQHAAHERIGFERLREIFTGGTPETQSLLIPQRIEFDPEQAPLMEENTAFFRQTGFEIEPFGGNAYALKSVPAVLQDADHGELIKDALDDLSDVGHTERLNEAVESVLSRMACHSVVRGPTELGQKEARSLLEQMDIIDFSANCPHGRPVYYRIPLKELEASFDRR